MRVRSGNFRLIAFFSILCASSAHPGIVINEIMYHSSGLGEVEYVELVNTGSVPQHLDGWYLLDRLDTHEPCVLGGTLEPGGYLILVNSLERFGATYPGAAPINPDAFGGATSDEGFGLDNSTDVVRLFDAGGTLIDSVAYSDMAPWPPEADGEGPSLELRNPAADNAVSTSWGASVNGTPGGTPGARNSIFSADTPPAFARLQRDVALPTAADRVTVVAEVVDDVAVTWVELFVDTGDVFAARTMWDDGLHGDGTAGDSVFGAEIAPLPSGTRVRYYAVATDDVAQSTAMPAGAPERYRAYTVGHTPPPLAITELLAANRTVASDGAGDFDDWVEIRNRGPQSVRLGGLYLSNNLDDPTMWGLPDIVVDAGEIVLIWCDEEPYEGPFHAEFRLSRLRGEIGLFDALDHGNGLIHGFRFGPQNIDVSFGYAPEGADAPEYLDLASPGWENAGTGPYSPICLNEFLAASRLGVADWVELYNRGITALDLSGWHLTDDTRRPTRYALPQGTILEPGEFLVLDRGQLGFGLDASGTEELLLTRTDGVTAQDYYDFGPQLPDVSHGRYGDGTPYWHDLYATSAGAANDCSGAVAVPGTVGQLRFDSGEALSWAGAGGARAYDVIRGNLRALRRRGGNFAQVIEICLENNSSDTHSFEPDDVPEGMAWFYLVRAVNVSCGLGSFDSGGSGQAASRDPAVSTSPAVCP